MTKYLLALFILYIAIYLVPLGGRPLITPDEYRYAEIPREMIESGDWITPKLLGVRYFEKPVMGYWLNAASLLLFGENSFAIRFASAFSSGLAAFLLWILVRRFSGDAETAWLATGIFMTSGLVYFVGTFAVLDSPTTMFVTGAMVSFFFAVSEEKWSRFKFISLSIFGVFCGLAFLTKGFLAFAVPFVTIVPYMFWEKRWKELFLLPWIPMLTALLVSLPWALAIHSREGNYWHYFFWVEHIQRIFGDSGTQHPSPFWLYFPILLGGLLPWTVFLPCSYIGLRKKQSSISTRPLLRFSICWVVFPLLLFSASSGKLATYILPCFPPLAIIMSLAMITYFRTGGSKMFNGICRFMAWTIFIGAPGFAAYQILSEFDIFPGLYSPAERWKWILAVLAILIWAFGFLAAWRCPKYRLKLVLLIFSPVFVFIIANYAAPVRILESKAQGLFLAKFRDRIKPDTVVLTHPNVMHAAAWEFRKSNLLLFQHGGELEYGLLKYPDAHGRIINEKQLHEMIKNTPKGKFIFIMRGDYRENIPQNVNIPFESYDHEIMFSNF